MRKTVMIVDASGNFRTVVKLVLQNAGYAVVEAVDGKHAVSKLMGQKLDVPLSPGYRNRAARQGPTPPTQLT